MTAEEPDWELSPEILKKVQAFVSRWVPEFEKYLDGYSDETKLAVMASTAAGMVLATGFPPLLFLAELADVLHQTEELNLSDTIPDPQGRA